MFSPKALILYKAGPLNPFSYRKAAVNNTGWLLICVLIQNKQFEAQANIPLIKKGII